MSETKQLVIVGDGTVGKTCIAHCYTNEAFLEDYIPTIFERSAFELTLDGVTHQIKLNDTAGQEDFDKMRRIIYKDASCFILCYSVDKPSTFHNISSKWIPELKTEDLEVPIVLVATKIDLRNGNGTYITTRDGENLRRKINANAFIECSAKTNTNIREVIYEAVRASMAGIPPKEESDDCDYCCCCTSFLSCFACFGCCGLFD